MKRRIRLTESDLHNIIRKSVKKVLMEAKLDDPHGALSSINDMWGNLSKDISKGAIEYNKKSNYPIESGLAQLIVDNGLSIDDVKQYKEFVNYIDIDVVMQKIKEYESSLRLDKYYDERNDAEAWAEEQMSDMGFGTEGD